MQDYQDRLRIQTPEGVEIDLVLAGLGSRFPAAIIDLIIKWLLIFGAMLLGFVLIEDDLGTAVAVVLSFILYFGYDVAFEVLGGGRTPGKRWTGLRVLRVDGRPVDLLSSAIRNVLRLVDELAYLPGIVSIVITERNQRLGDLAGRTIVVREPRTKRRRRFRRRKQEDDAFAFAGLSESSTAASSSGFAPPQAPDGARDGSPRLDLTGVTAEDLAAVRSFLERRDGLDEGVRADLAERLAGALAPRIGGAVGDLPPERLLALVAEKGRSAG